jgi:hypothetical protein
MEMLEGKYFEKPINLLKDLKNEEKIFVRPEFRERLRSELLEKTLNNQEEAEFGWVDLVLRMKYLFLGAPVLVVLVIVAASFSLSGVDLGSRSLPVGEIPSNTVNVLSLESATQVEPVSSLAKVSDFEELDEKDFSINPILEKNLSVKDFSVDVSSVGFTLSPLFLEEMRVYFQGEERSDLWSVLGNEFKLRNGNLSNDYQIVAWRLRDGNYKAVLFEYGQVKNILILAYRNGVLVVLTEVVY